MIEPIFKAHKEGGRLKIDDNFAFLNYVKGLPDTNLELRLSGTKKQRSNNQNNYLWGAVIKILCDETGNDKEDMYEFLKTKFNPKFIDVKNENCLIGGSFSELSTKEFEEKMDEIRAWASIEEGIYIPLPNEVDYE